MQLNEETAKFSFLESLKIRLAVEKLIQKSIKKHKEENRNGK